MLVTVLVVAVVVLGSVTLLSLEIISCLVGQVRRLREQLGEAKAVLTDIAAKAYSHDILDRVQIDGLERVMPNTRDLFERPLPPHLRLAKGERP